MLNTLKSLLGADQHLAMAQLARHICREETNQSLEETIITLLHGGYSVAQLLSALLQCESKRMQMLFSGHSALPLHVQFEDLRQTSHGFNEIQDTVMAVGETYLTELQARNIRGAAGISGKNEDRISEYPSMNEDEANSFRDESLAKSIDIWSQLRRVRLFNQFRGIPINASAQLMGKGKEKIRIALDREVAKVFACHADKNRVFLTCPHDAEQQISASILQLESGFVTLKLEEVSPSYVEKRRNLGVQVAEKIVVTLTSKGRKRGKAQLFDLSISGFGFIVTPDTTQPTLENGEELECEFQMGGNRIRASGWIRWQHQHDDMMRIGMELKSDRGLQQILQQEIFRLQRSIIVAMNEIDLPKEMRDALPKIGSETPPTT